MNFDSFKVIIPDDDKPVSKFTREFREYNERNREDFLDKVNDYVNPINTPFRAFGAIEAGMAFGSGTAGWIGGKLAGAYRMIDDVVKNMDTSEYANKVYEKLVEKRKQDISKEIAEKTGQNIDEVFKTISPIVDSNKEMFVPLNSGRMASLREMKRRELLEVYRQSGMEEELAQEEAEQAAKKIIPYKIGKTSQEIRKDVDAAELAVTNFLTYKPGSIADLIDNIFGSNIVTDRMRKISTGSAKKILSPINTVLEVVTWPARMMDKGLQMIGMPNAGWAVGLAGELGTFALLGKAAKIAKPGIEAGAKLIKNRSKLAKIYEKFNPERLSKGGEDVIKDLKEAEKMYTPDVQTELGKKAAELFENMSKEKLNELQEEEKNKISKKKTKKKKTKPKTEDEINLDDLAGLSVEETRKKLNEKIKAKLGESAKKDPAKEIKKKKSKLKSKTDTDKYYELGNKLGIVNTIKEMADMGDSFDIIVQLIEEMDTEIQAELPVEKRIPLEKGQLKKIVESVAKKENLKIEGLKKKSKKKAVSESNDSPKIVEVKKQAEEIGSEAPKDIEESVKTDIENLEDKVTDKPTKEKNTQFSSLDEAFEKIEEENKRKIEKELNNRLKTGSVSPVKPTEKIKLANQLLNGELIYIPGISELIELTKGKHRTKDLSELNVLKDLRTISIQNNVSFGKILDLLEIPKEEQIRLKTGLAELIKKEKIEGMKGFPEYTKQPDYMEIKNGDEVIYQGKSRTKTVMKGNEEISFDVKGKKITREVYTIARNMRRIKKKYIPGLRRAFENPAYTFDSLGQMAKDRWFHGYNKTKKIAIAEINEHRIKIKEMKKSLSNEEINQLNRYAFEQMGPKKSQTLKFEDLSEPTKNVYTKLRNMFDKIWEDYNKERVENGLNPMGYIDDYFSYMRNISFLERIGLIEGRSAIKNNLMVSEATARDRALVNSIPAPFAKKRMYKIAYEKLMDYGMLDDVFSVTDRYINTAIKAKHMTGMTQELKILLNGFKVKGKNGKARMTKMSDYNPEAAIFLREWINHINGVRVPNSLGIDPLLRTLSKNLAFAVLAGNFRTMFVQPLALRNTAVYLGEGWMAKGVLDFAKKGFKPAMKESNHLSIREFDTIQHDAIESLKSGNIGGIKSVIADKLMWPTKISDMAAATATYYAAKRFALNKGMSLEKAINFADDVVIKTQGSADPGHISPIQRSAVGRFATAFQTFAISDFNFLCRELLGKEYNHPAMATKSEISKILTYLWTGLLTNAVFEGMLETPSPFPSPEWETYRSQRDRDSMAKTLWRVTKEVGDVMPVFGNLRYGSTVLGMGYDTVSDISAWMFSDKYVTRPWENVATVAGVPLTRQISKTVRGYKEFKKNGNPLRLIFGPSDNKKKRIKLRF